MSALQPLPPVQLVEENETVDAYLDGGPADLPPELRWARVPRAVHKVKVEYRGGREQFACPDEAEADERGAVVYQWFQRTSIAE